MSGGGQEMHSPQCHLTIADHSNREKGHGVNFPSLRVYTFSFPPVRRKTTFLSAACLSDFSFSGQREYAIITMCLENLVYIKVVLVKHESMGSDDFKYTSYYSINCNIQAKYIVMKSVFTF